MNLGQLRAEFRRLMFDTAAPYLWSDDEIAGYFNEAVREAAIRAKLIQDETTDAYCKINIIAGTNLYTLNAKVCGIYRIKLEGAADPLWRKSREEMDMEYPGWEKQTGAPQLFTELNDTSLLRIVPTPVSDGVARLVVWRLPAADLVADADIPEIHEKYHYRLIDWARRCAYLKHDSETTDPVAAQRHELLFDASFGVRPDANVLRKRRENRSRVVRYGG